MIYVECRPDFALVKSISGVPSKEIVHWFGKYELCQRLEKQRNCRGMIDEDPWGLPPAYLSRLSLDSDLTECDLRVLYDRSNHNYLVVLRPRLEEWILKAPKEAGIDVTEYELPNNATKLHRVINIKLDSFERLLEALSGSERLKALKKLLERRS